MFKMKPVTLVAITLLSAAATIAPRAFGHGGEDYSAGEPGNPKKPARVVIITMSDTDGKMGYFPDKLEVRKGEQIKFVLKNNGALEHEFMLATVQENAEHAELMKKFPEMEHDDPNAKSIKPKQSADLLWQFTKAGEFQYACLIPGHMEAGMHGTVIVK
ncbi:Uncharacterized copper-binding protein, cupredoxin-like subfamily [Rhizobiales bacterium GAS191]|nr:Uncharacterized copper-binding protein, cupredoxin-like subfamily [Rhizobiales bacterium GAS113]SEE17183.1 Uncharacterized copper-binding protein, cupredoxin-like subfamily [Rhizobiales bacterium GAS191]